MSPGIIPCTNCGSEGRIIVAASPSRMNVDSETDCGPCHVCEGTGSEVIETKPITMEDLE